MYTQSQWSWIHPQTKRIRTKFMKRFYVQVLCAEWRSKKSLQDSESSLSSLYYKQFTLEWPLGWPGYNGDKIKISQEENLIPKCSASILYKGSTLTKKWPHPCGLVFKLMMFTRSQPRDLGAEKIAQIEFDGFEGDHLGCVSLNNSEPWHWWELVGIDADTGGIDARFCHDFLCWRELAINSPAITQILNPLASKLPAVLVGFVKSYKYILCCCDCRIMLI